MSELRDILIEQQGGGGAEGAVHGFTCEAMDTVFEVRICLDDAEYARQAAYEGFRVVDRLEKLLSRFIEGSDVQRINNLTAGKWTPVSEDTLLCLKEAGKLYNQTSGAFDVTIGPVRECWRDSQARRRQPEQKKLDQAILRTGMDLLAISDDEYAVGVKTDGVKIDLGGIGKGYTVDRIVQLLMEWEIENALIMGGASTVHGMGCLGNNEGWPVRLSDPHQPDRKLASFCLRNGAISSSGTQVRGEHVIDPRTGAPADAVLRAWARAPLAVTADALSTAFMVMSEDEIKRFCQSNKEIAALILFKDKHQQDLIRLGNWED